MRIDIRKYFDSIDHKALKKIAKTVIKEENIYNIVSDFIDTFRFKLTKDKVPIEGKKYYVPRKNKYVPISVTTFNPKRKYYECSNKSLGLGSQSSQLFALLTLNEIDHFIKEKLHIKYYGRYMDDLYLLHNDSKYLTHCKRQIEIKLKEIGLTMNNDKTTIIRIHPIGTNGIRKAPFKYLKWNFFITDTNHIIQIPFKKKISHQLRKLKKMYALWSKGKISTEEIQQSYQGWRAHMKKGTCYYIIQKMDNYFHSLFKGVEIK